MKKIFLLLCVVLSLLHADGVLAGEFGGNRTPNCPIGKPYRANDCYFVEQLQMNLGVYGSGVHTIVLGWFRIKTARSYVLEQWVRGRWVTVAHIPGELSRFEHKVGCGQLNKYRLYARDGSYRSRTSHVVTVNTFDCQ